MKNREVVSIFMSLFILFGLLSSAACMEIGGKPESTAEISGAKSARAAVNFRLKDINNNEVVLNSYINNQPVLLFFWTTWCPFCVEELSTLNPKYQQLKKDGCELLALNVGESIDKVAKYVKNYNLDFKVLLDKDRTVAFFFDILGVPTYVLINKKGDIVFQGHSFPQEYKGLILKPR